MDKMEVIYSCRCCLQGAPDKDVNRPYSHLGKTEIYSHMLKECFDISLSLDDGECGICWLCVDRLRDACDFKLLVMQNQVKLQVRFIEAQVKAKAVDVTIKRKVANEKVVEEVYSPDVPYDGDLEKSETVEEDQTNDCDPEESEAVEEIETIDGDLEKLDPLEINKSNVNPVVDADSDDNVLEDGPMLDESFKDPALNSEMSDADAPADAVQPAQVETETSETVNVGDDIILIDEDSLAVEPERPVTILDGEQVFSIRLERLRGDEAPRKNHTCPAKSLYEPQRVSRAKDMPVHTRPARAAKPAYMCDICGAQFTDKLRLIKHIQSHTSEPDKICIMYFCPICSKKFSSKTLIANHVHTKKKTYICDVCNRDFSVKSVLIKHLQTHNMPRKLKRAVTNYVAGQIPYCEKCNKTFKKKTLFSRA